MGEAISHSVLIVIEEIENGLHPSQAGRVLELIRDASEERGARVLVTTHSPALLDALEGKLNENVLVCYRDENTGHSKITRLTELSGYAQAMASGSLGDVVTSGGLTRPSPAQTPELSRLREILGMEA